MGSIKIAGKNIVTQSGSDEPTIASNVVFPDQMVVGTTVVHTSAFTTTQNIGNFNGDSCTIRNKGSRTCKSGNTVLVQLNCNEWSHAASSGTSDYFEIILFVSATDPGSTGGTSTNNIIDSSKQTKGSGAISYYATYASSGRFHGYSQRAYCLIPSDNTYYFFYIIFNNGSNTHNINWGLNVRPTLSCTEFTGSLI